MSETAGDPVELPFVINIAYTIEFIIVMWMAVPTTIATIILGFKFRRKGFPHASAKIFFVAVVNDFGHFYSSLVGALMPVTGLFSFYSSILDGFWPSLLTYFIILFGQQQYFFVCLIAINRCSSIMFPLGYQRFWNRFTLWTFVPIFVIPQLFCWRFFTTRTEYIQVSLTQFVIHPTVTSSGSVDAVLQLVLLFATTGIALLCNLYTGIKIFLLVRKTNEFVSSSKQRTDFRFHFVSFYMFTLQMIYAIAQIFNHTLKSGTPVQKVVMHIVGRSADLMCITPFWIWIILSADVRAILFSNLAQQTSISQMTSTSQNMLDISQAAQRARAKNRN